MADDADSTGGRGCDVLLELLRMPEDAVNISGPQAVMPNGPMEQYCLEWD